MKFRLFAIILSFNMVSTSAISREDSVPSIEQHIQQNKQSIKTLQTENRQLADELQRLEALSNLLMKKIEQQDSSGKHKTQ